MRDRIVLRRLAPSLLCVLLLCVLLLAAQTGRVFAQPAIPAGPSGEVLQAFLKAFNNGDRAALETFVNTYDPADTADGFLSFRTLTGGFTLLSIERSAPDAIRVRVRGNGDNLEAYGRIFLAATAPPKVRLLSFLLIPPGGVIEEVPLDAAARKRVIESVLSALKQSYVYLETAEKMSDAIHDNQQKGKYDGITDGFLLATQLDEDLRAVSHDRHLHVNYSPFKTPPQRPGPDPAAEARMRRELERNNCAFEKLEILPDNVGYVKFNAFLSPEICGATVAAAMNFLGHADALIFDLRDNGGGDPSMVALIATYLFDHPVHLSDIYNRREDSTTQYWTLPDVPGKRMPSTPAFVLTSNRTFSGAEDFTYNLQAIKRVTVIGETTGGGAHPTMVQPVDEHFSVGVPFARSINLITKTNWEGTGVTPDVQVKSTEALQAAQRMAVDKIRGQSKSIAGRMAADANPGLAVATIKPSEPGGRPKPKGLAQDGQDILTFDARLSDLIMFAYDIHTNQIKRGPAWLESDKYDVTVRPDVPGQPNIAQMRVLFQKLLADRFQLKFHREKEELSVYALTVAGTGAKITKSQADPDGLPGYSLRPAPSGTSFNITNSTLAEFITVLHGFLLDKPVVDQTGLSGRYDIPLTFAPDAAQAARLGVPPLPAGDNLNAGPDLFTAFQQQLGLKLESTKAPVDVLVVDHVEKPSAN